jgi:hypothetical protein
LYWTSWDLRKSLNIGSLQLGRVSLYAVKYARKGKPR